MSFDLSDELSKGSDVVLISNDNKRYHAHKFILRNWSRVFAHVLEEGSFHQVELPLDDSSQDLDTFLGLIYPTELDLSDANVLTALYVADKYDSPTLTRRCFSFIELVYLPSLQGDELNTLKKLLGLLELGKKMNKERLVDTCCQHLGRCYFAWKRQDPSIECVLRDLGQECLVKIITSIQEKVEDNPHFSYNQATTCPYKHYHHLQNAVQAKFPPQTLHSVRTPNLSIPPLLSDPDH